MNSEVKGKQIKPEKISQIATTNMANIQFMKLCNNRLYMKVKIVIKNSFKS